MADTVILKNTNSRLWFESVIALYSEPLRTFYNMMAEIRDYLLTYIALSTPCTVRAMRVG